MDCQGPDAARPIKSEGWGAEKMVTHGEGGRTNDRHNGERDTQRGRGGGRGRGRGNSRGRAGEAIEGVAGGTRRLGVRNGGLQSMYFPHTIWTN